MQSEASSLSVTFPNQGKGDGKEGNVTDDALLGGRLRLLQPRRGHRVGHDAILLAAFCQADAGDTVVELGAGVGAAGLALATRVGGTTITLVDIDPDLTALAAANAERNGLAARVRAIVLDVAASGRAFMAAGLAAHSQTRVMMNPPFNDAGRHQLSPDAGRRLAHAAPRAMLADWVRTAARLLRPRGAVSLIWRADGLAEALAALEPAFGGVAILPVQPKPGHEAIRVLVRAIKGSRAPLTILPALILNDASGCPTAAAEAVLRGGELLALAKA